MAKDILTIPSGKNSLAGRLCLPNGGPKRGVVFFHGGGDIGKEKYYDLQDILVSRNTASLAFDFSGVGQSTGIFSETSLLTRIDDAKNVCAYFFASTGLTEKETIIVGSSMGAHIACKIIAVFPELRGAVLTSAAAYGPNAENKLFNQEFTNEVQREKSWENSPAFKNASTFKGKILMVYGSEDKIVPNEVQEGYKRACSNNGRFVTLKGGSHKLLMASNDQEQKTRRELFRLITEFVES